jgi:hypothetical protein
MTNRSAHRNKKVKTQAFTARYDVDKLSKEEVLAQQLERWHSEVYSHYVLPPTIMVENDNIKYRFICKKCVFFFSFDIKVANVTLGIPQCSLFARVQMRA